MAESMPVSATSTPENSSDLVKAQDRVYSLRSRYQRLNYALSFERDGVRTKIETALRRGHIELTEEIRLAVGETRPAQFLRLVQNIPAVDRFVRHDARERLTRADEIMEEITALRQQFRNALQLIDADIETLTVSLPKCQAEIDFAAAAKEGAARFEEKTRRKNGRAAPRSRTAQKALPRSGAPKIEGEEDTGAFGAEEDAVDAGALPEEMPRNDTEHILFQWQYLLTKHGTADENETAVYGDEFEKTAAKFAGLRDAEGLPDALGQRCSAIFRQVGRLFSAASGTGNSSLEQDKIIFSDARAALYAMARKCGIDSDKILNQGRRSTRREWDLAQEEDVLLDTGANLLPLYAAKYFAGTNFIWMLINKILRDAKAAGQDTSRHYAIYYDHIRDLSLRLRPRAMRKAAEILHSAPINTKDFRQKLENKEFPPNLWRQQRELLHAVERGLRHGERRMYFETPPGTGKTRVLLLLAQMLNPNGNTLLLVPNQNLVSQHEMEFEKSGLHMPHGKGGRFDMEFDQPVTIATYRGLQWPIQRGLFARDQFSLILFDEAHKTLGLERERIFEYFPQATVIGATGSGQDADGTSVNRTFKCVYHISLLDGIRAGMVNPMRLHTADIPSVSSSMKDAPMKDILAQDLKYRIQAILQWYKTVCRRAGKNDSDKQALIIMDTNQRTEEVIQAFNKEGIEAKAIHTGRMYHDVHYWEILFREGRFPVAATSHLLVEGWDHEGLECLAIGDQGTSGAYYLQRMGRAARRTNTSKGDSHILILRGGIALDNPDRGGGGHGKTIVELPRRTPIEKLFGLDEKFESGSRIAEPQEGFWPKNRFKFPK